MLTISRWQIVFVSLILLGGLIFALPNFLSPSLRSKLPGFLPSETISLGLDLQGGSYLLYEVDLKTVQREQLEKTLADIRRTLREAQISFTGLHLVGDHINLTVEGPDNQEKAYQALQKLSQPLSLSLGGSVQSLSFQKEDGGRLQISMPEEALKAIQDTTLANSIEVIRRRLNEFGATEPNLQRQGSNRILVQAPGVDDPKRLKSLIGQTARMTFHLVRPSDLQTLGRAQQGAIPAGHILAPSDNPAEPFLLLKKKVLLEGKDLVQASQQFSPDTGEPIVAFRFNAAGGAKFGRVTSKNVGQRFAIVLDDRVISAPVINTPILGGSGIIEGNFTVETSHDLAVLLSAGALPADLTVVEERTVGAELGADSIRAGTTASLIGFLAVVVFIFLAYGLRFGFFANMALLSNLILIAGALSVLPVTLTLPGVAGVILTIGMAVDANVLIFERIREERDRGKSPMAAVDSGYRLALAPILDANITTLIAAFVLVMVGSGPVQGFAYTLAVGVVTSVFTAFWVSRFFAVGWLRSARPKTLPI